MSLRLAPIFVLGLPQCGTAEIAADLASRLGIPSPSIREEHRRLYAFNRRCLAAFGLDVLSIGTLPEAWRRYPQAEVLLMELREILRTEFSTPETALIEQPLACLLAPLYKQALVDLDASPEFVVCLRNPVEIQESERQNLGAHLKPLWLRYSTGALDLAQEWPIRCESTSRGHTDDNFGLSQAILALAEPGREVDRSEIQQILAEYRILSEIFAPAQLSGTQVGFAWKLGAHVHSSVQPFLPAYDWQTIAFEFDAPPGTVLDGVFYNKAVRLWIRRAEVHCEGFSRPVALAAGPGSDIGRLGDIVRLDGAYEPTQLSLKLPMKSGPYRLELDVLLESNQTIANETTQRLTNRLYQVLMSRNSGARG